MSEERSTPHRVLNLSARYSQEAEAYRTYWAPALLSMTRAHLEALRVEHADRVLDVGTGTGSALADLQCRFPGARVYGIDRAMGMLREAKSDLPLACMDASRLAFAPASFDLITMSFMLFHLPDPGMGLREARRALRDGGTVALTTWAGDAECEATRIWSEELDARGATPLQELEHLAQHELMDSIAKVEILLRASGFDDLDVGQRTFAYPMTAESMLQLKTRLGRSRRRLESLHDQARQECVTRVRERFAALSAAEMMLRLPVILAAARAAY